jgi:hypothetical protein
MNEREDFDHCVPQALCEARSCVDRFTLLDESRSTQDAARELCNGEPGLLVVTWHNVGYYNTHDDRKMDFQLILRNALDCGSGDFDVEFRYNRCEWTTGDASGGSGGFGGTPAQQAATRVTVRSRDAARLTHRGGAVPLSTVERRLPRRLADQHLQRMLQEIVPRLTQTYDFSGGGGTGPGPTAAPSSLSHRC